MGTYQARHAAVEVEASPQRRLLMRGGLATAAATAITGVGLLTPVVAAPRTVKQGSRGSAVRDLQTKLLRGGYRHSGVDGVFGSSTRRAVVRLQGDHRLTRDGICGSRTWAVVNRLGRSGGSAPKPKPRPQPTPKPSSKGTLKPGSKGSAVKSLQSTLRANGYWLSSSDGQYGQTTQQAVMAVQKVHGLPRDGVCGPATRAVIDRLSRPRGRTRSGTVMEIDLSKQIIIFVVAGRTKWVFNTSTGTAGWRTPRGRFTIFRQINGMRHAPLGQLWRPKYFNGGIAIHGSSSIPGYAASHGCARMANACINYVWSANLAPIGRRVWVY